MTTHGHIHGNRWLSVGAVGAPGNTCPRREMFFGCHSGAAVAPGVRWGEARVLLTPYSAEPGPRCREGPSPRVPGAEVQRPSLTPQA